MTTLSSSHFDSQRSHYLTPRQPLTPLSTSIIMNRRSWNPFSSSKRSNLQDASLAPSNPSNNLLGRALSRRSSAKKENASAARPLSPPPAYSVSAAPATSSTAPASEPHPSAAPSRLTRDQASTAEDPYAFLSKFDTVFLIDDSGSMSGRSWRETKAAMGAILPVIFSHDQDGPDIYFMNHKSSDQGSTEEPWKAGTGYRNVTRSEGATNMREQFSVEELFSMTKPYGATPTGTRLGHILRSYMKAYQDEVTETGDVSCLTPLNIIVVTDGVPSDDVESVIIQTARKLDNMGALPWQIGIQFFQVGNEHGAAEGLRQLDDDISAYGGGVRDIVDTVTFDSRSGSHPVLSSDAILKTVLGAVIKRLDRKTTGSRSRRR
jgi:uncharacterized protein YegL